MPLLRNVLRAVVSERPGGSELLRHTPGGRFTERGVITMDLSAAAVTLSEADPLIEPRVAVIVVDPCVTLVASPLFP